MLYLIQSGDIMRNEQSASSLVIPVNCVGVMGAGLALHYSVKSLGGYRMYKRMCMDGQISIGNVGYVQETSYKVPYKYTIFFPTKNDFRYPTELTWIGRGLASLVGEIDKFPALGEHGISIPALGCGLGGMSYDAVYPLLTAFAELVKCDVFLYAPRAERGTGDIH